MPARNAGGMRTEAQVFLVIAGFMVLVGGGYAWWTDAQQGAVEWAGSVALLLSGVLAASWGFYFGVVARRIDPRPEDRSDAEIADGAGDLGYFSPASYWPLGVGLAAALMAFALAASLWWLVAVGLAGMLMTVGGLLYENYVLKDRRSG